MAFSLLVRTVPPRNDLAGACTLKQDRSAAPPGQLFTASNPGAERTAGRALQVVFFTLTTLFWLLALGDITGNESITRLAGVEGIFCCLAAIYTALAQVLNEMYGKTILPIGARG